MVKDEQFENFFNMMVKYLTENERKEIAAKLLEPENKAAVIEYLKKNEWTATHMAESHINNGLSNTKGTRINPYCVCISHFNHYGNPTTPYIHCSADKFTIFEWFKHA